MTRTFAASGQVIDAVYGGTANRLAEYDGATGALIRQYLWLGDIPIAVKEGGQIYLVRTDHIGRPVFATTLAGAQVWSARYLPFGGVHVTSGAPIDLRFPGQWFQTESGLYQNWMRDYDPTTGRYVEADPLGLVDGASVYGYARQNPLRWVDPRGTNAGVLAPLVCTGPQAIPCAIVLACAGLTAAIIYNESGIPPAICENCVNSDTPEPPFDYPEGWDGATPPVPDWTWKGPDAPGGRGNWVSPDGKKSVGADLNHPPGIPPHIDLNERGKRPSRWYPDGTVEPKPKR